MSAHAPSRRESNITESSTTPASAGRVVRDVSSATGLVSTIVVESSAPAHPQLRQLSCPLLKEFRERVPVLFDDVGDPDCEEIYKEG